MKTLETYVVVVAAGLSSLAATVASTENGVQVIAFKKSNTTGGATNTGARSLGMV